MVLERIDRYMKDLGSSEKPPLVVYGETGSGKSCVMAAAIKVCKSSITRGENRCCVMRFIGLTPSSTSIRRLLASICEQVILPEFYLLWDGSFLTRKCSSMK